MKPSIIITKIFLFAILTSVTTSACKKKSPEPKMLNLVTNIEPYSKLKLSDGEWEINDRVGLFMIRPGKQLGDVGALHVDVNNVEMSIYGQTLMSRDNLFYPIKENVDFIAYYPYRPDLGYTLDINVANQAAGIFAEPLYSNNVTNQPPTDAPVTLNFVYPLAKLAVTVTEVEGSANITGTDFAVMSIALDGMYTGARLQLNDGAFVGHQNRAVITMRKTESTLTSASFEALVFPFEGELTFLFNIGGRGFSYAVNGRYVEAFEYRFDFALNTADDATQEVTMLNSSIAIPRAAKISFIPNSKLGENEVGNVAIKKPLFTKTQIMNEYKSTNIRHAPYNIIMFIMFVLINFMFNLNFFFKMKKQFFSYALSGVLVLGAMAGCNRDKPDRPEPSGPVAVNLRANIGPSSKLKVSNDQWETTDKVGLYMVQAGKALDDVGAIFPDGDNVQMEIDGGVLTSTPELYYPIGENVGFIAYYPYTSPVGAGYTIDVNVADQATVVETLYSANITNQAATEDPVVLEFNYSLAKIVVNVTGGLGSGLTSTDLDDITISINGMFTEAKLNLVDGSLTDHDAQELVELKKTGPASASVSFEALVLPAAAGERTFVFTVGGKPYSKTVNDAFQTATEHIFNFTLNLDGVTQTLSLLNATINARTPAAPVDYEIDLGEELTPITEITVPIDDIDLILVNDVEKVVNVTVVEPVFSAETIEWKATTAGIVTLTPTNNGRTVTVTAVAAGTTEIYAESESGGAISDEITVNVAPQQYNEYSLPFDPGTASGDLSYAENAGISTLTVTGGNPFIFFMPFVGYTPNQAPKILIVFDYTTNNRASNSVIFHFFGGGNSVGQTALDIKIPAASEWTEFSYDLTAKIKSTGWGWPGGDQLRFSPMDEWGEDNYTGSNVPAFTPGFELTIKNPRIRLYLN